VRYLVIHGEWLYGARYEELVTIWIAGPT